MGLGGIVLAAMQVHFFCILNVNFIIYRFFLSSFWLVGALLLPSTDVSVGREVEE